MTDALDRLTAALSDRYTIERELGSGGMATVYLAHDIRHDRPVAVKVLRPELASALGPDRFLREIRIAANLDHPHILPLLDSGEADGLLYYVMPYVEGESLRDRLNREKQLPIDDAIQITLEVADALDFAHQHAVVHRDIKSDNILLSAGHARVADFGIAKAIGAAGGEQITETGLAVGTPEYMSPEQAAGESDVDGRSDIYALGCVLYEMLAGQPPFTGATVQSVVRQHLTADATPITNVRAAVPAPVANALTRSLAKAPADRYRTASEFSQAIKTGQAVGQPRWQQPLGVATLYGAASLVVLTLVYILMIQLGLPNWVVPGAIVLLVAGLPIVTTTAIVQRGRAAQTAGGMRRWFAWRRALLGGGLAFAGLAAVTGTYLGMRALGIGPAGTLLATGAFERGGKIILADFENRTDDPTLGPSLTAALRVDLSQSRVITLIDAAAITAALRRMERTGAAQLDAATAREVAEREGVEAVISGEISRLGGGYLLLANLMSAATGEVLASVRETAAAEEDIIAALDRLSAGLRDRIGEPLKAIRASPSLARVTTPSLAALRKLSQAQRLRAGGDEQSALALLEDAVVLDTAFAMAYREIGTVVGNLGLSRRRSIEARRKAFQYRDRLTERERLFMMGSYYARVTGELDKAQAAYEALVEAYPDHKGGWGNLGNVFGAKRQHERAEVCHQRAYDLGGNAFGLYSLVSVQVALGKFDEAETNLERLNPASDYYYVQAARLAYAQGDYASATSYLQSLAEASSPLERARALAHIHAVRAIEGKLGEAERYRSEATDLLVQAGAGRDFLVVTASGATIRLALSKDVDDAARDVEAALVQFPLDSLDPLERPYFDLAMYYALADRAEQAKELVGEWEELVEPDLRRRDEPKRLFVRGVIALSENRAVDAVRELRQALEAEPALFLQVVLPLLGRAYEIAAQADSAIAAYEEYLRSSGVRIGLGGGTSMMASAHNPDAAWRADTYVRLGSLYEQRGNRDLAVDYYNRFVDLWQDADAELQPQVEDVKRRIARLAGELQRN
jgi:tetratricopeptide (TPR) repeat protein